MKKERRTFSKEFKLKVLKEASTQGSRKTIDKYGLYGTTYFSWEKNFQDMGEDRFAHSMTKEHLQKIKELEQENELLKLLLAEERIAGKLKDKL